MKDHQWPHEADAKNRNQLFFVIEGKPQAQLRPRVTRYGAYTPAHVREHANRVKSAALRAVEDQDWQCEDGMYELNIRFVFHVPESQRRKTEMVKTRPRVKKPDLSNLVKQIEDALNGIAYPDDAQVVRLEAAKWDVYPDVSPERTEISVVRSNRPTSLGGRDPRLRPATGDESSPPAD